MNPPDAHPPTSSITPAYPHRPAAAPAQAGWQETVARATFVQIHKPASVGQVWRKLGVGLGGLALVAVLAWAAVRYPTQDATPVAIEAPSSRQANALDMYPESGTPMPEATIPLQADDSQTASSEGTAPTDEAAATPGPAPGAGVPQRDKDEAPPAPSYETTVRLEKGDTFGSVLHGLGLATEDIGNAIAALASHVSMNRLPVGQAMTLKLRTPQEATAKPILLALAIRPEARREITLERDDEGDYSVEEEVFDIVSKLQRATGTVDGSVIASAEAAGVPRPALAEMLRAFSWDVNFQYDIKVGDRFDVLIEQSWTSDGKPVDAGRVLLAELTTVGGLQSYSVYRFEPRDGAEFFYNREGESVVKALLRTPLNMSSLSSGFGLRHHPVLGFTRLHAGVDFAAPPGTPILAAGAGRVVEAGSNGGYGRWVKISHEDGLATGYAHLSRIAPGVRRSARVRQGQVIGFVGSSGLSTGPHLHFELHRNGRPVDPLSVAGTALRTRLRGDDLARFKKHVVEIDRARDSAAMLERQ
jgi:murein DD-endopeptidase MepM/ murein hydrolase activator NlpD